MIIRNILVRYVFVAVVMLALSVGARAQFSVDEYKSKTGLAEATSVFWCDPVPDCEIFQINPVNQSGPHDRDAPVGAGASVFIIVVVDDTTNVPRPESETDFLKTLVDTLRNDGFEILAAAYMNSDGFAAALKCDLSKECD